MNKVKVYAATVIAITFWGLSYIWSNRLLQQGIPVEYFLPIRIFIAALILFVVNLLCGYNMKIQKDDWRNFLALAICEPFIYFFCETYGIQFTGSPTISALVIASTPVVAIGAGVIFFKEKITWQHVVGMIICLSGLVLVTGAQGSTSRLFVFGIIVLMLAVFAEVGYASFTKALSGGYEPSVIVMYQFLIGTVCFIPLFLTRGMENFDADVYLGKGFWEPVLCLSVLCSSVAFALWAYSIKHLGVAKSSIFQAMTPVVAAIAGFVLGEEKLCNLQWIGLCVAIAGVVLTQLNIGKKDLFSKTSGSAGR
ncbi:MAG: DMT family transporter [Bacteroidales bacterium]|nr:DMT family transporter [Bacteroidales bacterium]